MTKKKNANHDKLIFKTKKRMKKASAKKHDDKEILKNKQNTNPVCKGCLEVKECNIGRLAFVAGCQKSIVKTDNVKLNRPQQNNKTSSMTSMFNDQEYVKNLTDSDISEFSRYELFKCNKIRKKLGLEVLRRKKEA